MKYRAWVVAWWEVHTSRIKRYLKSFKYFLPGTPYRIIKHSGLFDDSYYLKRDREMSALCIDPLQHYVEEGWQEDRSPNPLFDAHWYRQQYLVPEDQDTLLHYIQQGARGGCNPHPLFWNQWYLDTYPDVATGDKTALADYRDRGWEEGRNPNPLFDSLFYGRSYISEKDFCSCPLEHYLTCGFDQQLSADGLFDVKFYLEDNPSAARLRIPALLHFIRFGAEEGRSPNRLFDPFFYQRTQHLENLSRVDLFVHFVEQGRRHDFRPTALFDQKFYNSTYADDKGEILYPVRHYLEHGVFDGHYPCSEVADLPKKPVISLLTPVYNSDEHLLRRCIHSVLYQAYPHWELCLVDDGSSGEYIRSILEEYRARDTRIKIHFLEQNQGISTATNTAAALATGEYIAFLDHDDELTLDALYRVVSAINTEDPDILYTDEDLIDLESRYLESFYKPDYNPELLLCHNYITHLCVVRRELFDQVGGLSPGCTGAQDYDLLLKITELSGKVHHIRRSLYKWRATETSTSINHSRKDYADAAGLHALQTAVKRRGLSADVRPGQWKFYYELRRAVKSRPLVSIIARVSEDVQETVIWLQHVLTRTRYENIEIHLLSRMPVAEVEHDGLPDDLIEKVTLHHRAADESEALALNRLAELACGEHLVFMRQGMLPRQDSWVELFLGYSLTEEFGVVGGMVSRDEGQLDNPAIPDTADWSCAMFRSFLVEGSFHLNGISCPQNVTAVSFDFCMVHRLLFQQAGGFDAEHFPRYLYDIDFCLRLRREGLEHVVTPFCTVVFQEQCAEKIMAAPCDHERRVFQKQWRQLLLKNPYYNEQRLLQQQGVSRDEWQHWVAGMEKTT